MLSYLDPRFQPIGITNGLVTRGGELEESRLSGSCNHVSIVWGQLDASMTIKGIAIQSTDKTEVQFPMEYAYINDNPWMKLKQSSRIDNSERVCFIKSFLLIINQKGLKSLGFI